MTKEYTFDFIREAENADTAIQIAHQDLLKTVPKKLYYDSIGQCRHRP